MMPRQQHPSKRKVAEHLTNPDVISSAAEVETRLDHKRSGPPLAVAIRVIFASWKPDIDRRAIASAKSNCVPKFRQLYRSGFEIAGSILTAWIMIRGSQTEDVLSSTC